MLLLSDAIDYRSCSDGHGRRRFAGNTIRDCVCFRRQLLCDGLRTLQHVIKFFYIRNVVIQFRDRLHLNIDERFISRISVLESRLYLCSRNGRRFHHNFGFDSLDVLYFCNLNGLNFCLFNGLNFCHLDGLNSRNSDRLVQVERTELWKIQDDIRRRHLKRCERRPGRFSLGCGRIVRHRNLDSWKKVEPPPSVNEGGASVSSKSRNCDWGVRFKLNTQRATLLRSRRLFVPYPVFRRQNVRKTCRFLSPEERSLFAMSGVSTNGVVIVEVVWTSRAQLAGTLQHAWRNPKNKHEETEPIPEDGDGRCKVFPIAVSDRTNRTRSG